MLLKTANFLYHALLCRFHYLHGACPTNPRGGTRSVQVHPRLQHCCALFSIRFNVDVFYKNCKRSSAMGVKQGLQETCMCHIKNMYPNKIFLTYA